MLRVKYMLETDGTMVIHFYNHLYLWIGSYNYEPLEDNGRFNDYSIPDEYKQEVIDYLKTVGVKINE